MYEYETLLPPATGIGNYCHHQSWKVRFKHFLHNGQGSKASRSSTSPGLRSSQLHITEPKLASSSANIIDVSDLAVGEFDYVHYQPCPVLETRPAVNPRTSSLYSFDPLQQPADDHKRLTFEYLADAIVKESPHSSVATAVDFQQELNRRVEELEKKLKTTEEEISDLKQRLQAEKERNSFLCQKIYDQHVGCSAQRPDSVQIVTEYKRAIRRLKHQRDIETSQAPNSTEGRLTHSFSHFPKMAKRRSPNGIPHSVPIQTLSKNTAIE